MNKPNVTEILVQQFVNSIKECEKQPRKIKPVRIRIKSTGKWLQTHSKKTIWKRKGDASNALALHLEYTFSGFRYNYIGSCYIGPDGNNYTYEQMAAIQDAAKKYIKENLIEFVEVDS